MSFPLKITTLKRYNNVKEYLHSNRNKYIYEDLICYPLKCRQRCLTPFCWIAIKNYKNALSKEV